MIEEILKSEDVEQTAFFQTKFEAYTGLSTFIQTEWSKGYKFVPK